MKTEYTKKHSIYLFLPIIRSTVLLCIVCEFFSLSSLVIDIGVIIIIVISKIVINPNGVSHHFKFHRNWRCETILFRVPLPSFLCVRSLSNTIFFSLRSITLFNWIKLIDAIVSSYCWAHCVFFCVCYFQQRQQPSSIDVYYLKWTDKKKWLAYLSFSSLTIFDDKHHRVLFCRTH